MLEVHEKKVNYDLNTGLYIDDLREIENGKFAATVDAMIASHGEQKSAAKLLGISPPAMSQRISVLRSRFGNVTGGLAA